MRKLLLQFARRATPSPIKRFLNRAVAEHFHLVPNSESLWDGFTRNRNWPHQNHGRVEECPDPSNPLWVYFDSHREGPGIWKWVHYFDVYHQHFNRFRGREVHVLEIGIYSGGSLGMWKDYFGPECHVYGVDREESCKRYEDDSVKVFIGDQADRAFWRRVREQVPTLDIVIDDGGHEPTQQIVTLEELLPHLQPGGVFLCEDVHGTLDEFALYVNGLMHNLNAMESVKDDPENNERRIVCKATGFQSSIRSMHWYPFVTVIEKRNAPITELVAPKHGSQWEPFLK